MTDRRRGLMAAGATTWIAVAVSWILVGGDVLSGALVAAIPALLVGIAMISFWRLLDAKVDARTEELRRSEARFRSLAQNASDVITLVAPDGSVHYQSPSIRAVFGYEPEALDRIAPLELVHPEDLAGVLVIVRELARGRSGTNSVQCRIRHADGRWRHVEVVVRNLLHDEAVAAFVVNTRDITERKERDRLTHQAFHDPLTNLPNRSLFGDRLAHAVQRTSRDLGSAAVLFLDLDDFKDVNDSFGHAVGDELLAKVADRLRRCSRSADTVARIGGDEFAALVEGSADRETVTMIAERMLAALEAPFDLDGRRVFVSGSIGIAVWPEAGETPTALVHNADLAMYMAKAAGKGTIHVFEPRVAPATD